VKDYSGTATGISEEIMKKREKIAHPEIKNMIAERALSTDKDRITLAYELIDEIMLKYPDRVPPSVETVKRDISTARNHAPSPLDKPWHMGTLKDYPLPLEAVSSILAALESREMFTRHREVTIRQALWISRLHTVVKHKDDLWKIAWHYAFNERISEVSGTDFNTSEYDRRLPNPKELLEYFTNLTQKVDFATYKKVFEQTSGVEYAGVSFPVDFMVFNEDKVFAPIIIKDKPSYLEVPSTDSKALLEGFKKENNIKSIKKLDNGTTLVVLKKSVSLAFENKEFNEYLHNFIKDGENK